MSKLPHALYYAADVRRLDQLTMDSGITGIELMTRAGVAVFNELHSRWPEAKRIAIFCGAGNNAGDGYIIARLALEQGLTPLLVALAEPSTLTGDAVLAWRVAQAVGLKAKNFSVYSLNDVDVVVDAMLGTGLDRPVRGEYGVAINAINNSGLPVVAVDLPSGLHADSGRILGCAIKATCTVSVIALKPGLLTAQGPDCCGALVFDALGAPDFIYEQVMPMAARMDWASEKAQLLPRARSAHKGNCGHVLVVGGNHGMAGAVRLAAEAALRVGAGLVSAVTRPTHVGALVAVRPEVMWHGEDDVLGFEAQIEKASVIAIGPGLGQDEWAQSFLMLALESGRPLVIDADALNLLAVHPARRDDWIMTPHPGEAARLLHTSSDKINANRFAAAQKIQKRYGGITVLKGAGTVVCEHSGQLSVCSDGNPGMASGGMGDVLTGVIAGLLAQRLPLDVAARLGVTLHAAAADCAAKEGERGMIATDLMPYLRRLLD